MLDVLAATGAETFAHGTGIAWLALDLSALGALVSFACIRHAKYSIRFRLIWLTMAAVSLGGVGLWLANSVALLAMRVNDSTVRYNVALGAAALAIAVVGVLAGLLISGRTTQAPRLIIGGLTMGLSVGLSTYLTLDALAVQGTVEESLGLIGVSVLVSMALCTATLWVAQVVRRVPVRVLVSVLFALGVAAVYYTALAALKFSIDPAVRTPDGLPLFDLVFPMFVIGALGLTVPITAVLVAPDRRDVAAQARQPVPAR
ncbi:MHYT domain-containing protein [Nocardia salmonicida]|uniref:MHYT domain-containing protein n=1 Tax=Nocardia salmonicida TaxID=53431 RepID=UPI0036387DB6